VAKGWGDRGWEWGSTPGWVPPIPPGPCSRGAACARSSPVARREGGPLRASRGSSQRGARARRPAAPSAFEPFKPGPMDSARSVPSRRSVQAFLFSSSVLTYLFSILDSLRRGRSTFAASIFFPRRLRAFGGPHKKDLARQGCTLSADGVRCPARRRTRLTRRHRWRNRRWCPTSGPTAWCPSVPARSARELSRSAERRRVPRS
jgi:hypothetical protein